MYYLYTWQFTHPSMSVKMLTCRLAYLWTWLAPLSRSQCFVGIEDRSLRCKQRSCRRRLMRLTWHYLGKTGPSTRPTNLSQLQHTVMWDPMQQESCAVHTNCRHVHMHWLTNYAISPCSLIRHWISTCSCRSRSQCLGGSIEFDLIGRSREDVEC